MKDFTSQLALSSLIVMGLVCLSSVAVASADTDNFPTLENALVTPEDGPWGSTFTYEVTYTDNENNTPAVGYPKVYINGLPENMENKDPTDNDVTDGKVYQYTWVTTKENIGLHSFYFYVEMPAGENARDPENGNYGGPEVEKLSLSLSCEVDTPEISAGETITFSGYLRTDENSGVSGENITIYKIRSDENIVAGSAITDENGYFTASFSVSSLEIFCYRAQLSGDTYYDTSESLYMYVNTLDKTLIFGVYTVAILILTVAVMFLLSRRVPKAHYLKPILIGFVLGFFLLQIGAADLGIFAAGVIAGYLFAGKAREWTKQLRIGFITGFLFLPVVGIIITYILTVSPELLSLRYSITQGEVFSLLFDVTIFYAVYYLLMAGIGAVLGGMLRKILKPTEQKPQQ